jgi:hypothetical protein
MEFKSKNAKEGPEATKLARSSLKSSHLPSYPKINVFAESPFHQLAYW